MGTGVLSSLRGEFTATANAGTKTVTVSAGVPLTAAGVLGGYYVDASGVRHWLDPSIVIVTGRVVEFATMATAFVGTEEVSLFLCGTNTGERGAVYSHVFIVPDAGLVETVDLTGLIDFSRYDSFELAVEAVADVNLPHDADTAVEIKAKGISVQGAVPVVMGGNIANAVKRAAASIRRGVWATVSAVQNGVGWDSLEAVPYPIGSITDGLLVVNFKGGESIYDPGEKATGSVRLTGAAAAVIAVDDIVSGGALNFKATEEVTVPSGSVPVVIDADTDVLAAAAHGFANGTVGRMTAQIVAAVKATTTLLVTGVGETLVEIGDLFYNGAIEYEATETVTIPTGPLAIVPDPDTEKMGAVAHGYANGTKGKISGAVVPAVDATGIAVVTGTGAAEIAQGSKFASGAIEFETDAIATIPAGTLSVIADPNVDNFTAAGHGYANGTKGRFTAPYTDKATGVVVLTGAAEAVAEVNDEVSAGAIVFKVTTETAVPADGLAVVAVPADDKFTAAAHGYAVGTKGQFTGVALPSGIAASTDYYIVEKTANDFKVSLTEGGEVDTFSDAGDTVVFTASVRKIEVPVEAAVAGLSGNVLAGTITTQAITDFTDCTNPADTSGGTAAMDIPAELDESTDYYIVARSADAFQVSLSEDGAAVEFSTAGTDVIFEPSVRKISIAITAVVGGTAGNVLAHTITTIPTPIAGVSAVDNPNLCADGADAYQDIPTGLDTTTDYYIVARAANDFKIALTDGGDPIDFTGTGASVVFTPSVRKVNVAAQAVVGGVSGNCLAHEIDEFDETIVGVTAVDNVAALTDGVDEYQLLPTGITLTTDLYMRDRAADSFKLALTSTGAAIDFADTGTDVVFVPTVRKVDCAVEAEEVGVAYNLDPNTVTTEALTGFSAVTNPAATTGGEDEVPEDTYSVRVTIAAR
jgi:hypothetical protein